MKMKYAIVLSLVCLISPLFARQHTSESVVKHVKTKSNGIVKPKKQSEIQTTARN